MQGERKQKYFDYRLQTAPFLVSLQVVWNGVQLLLGDQTGSKKGGWNYSFSRLITVFTPVNKELIIHKTDLCPLSLRVSLLEGLLQVSH